MRPDPTPLDYEAYAGLLPQGPDQDEIDDFERDERWRDWQLRRRR